VITAGPDFFFVVDDLDNDPATVEVVSAQFFAPTVGLYVLSASNGSLLQKLVIDDTIGPAEGIMLVDLNGALSLFLLLAASSATTTTTTTTATATATTTTPTTPTTATTTTTTILLRLVSP
jgi:hypothetical protein